MTALSFSCPDHVNDRQSIPESVAGWQAQTDEQRRRLDQASVFSGHPSHRASIQGDAVKGGMRWRVDSDGFWAMCEYQNTSARLIRPIPRNSTCVYRMGNTMESPQAGFECRVNPPKR